jgi:hypothetical protein
VSELHPVIYDLVPSVARTIHRRYKTHVEFDDIKQELMAWAMTRIADHTEDLMEIDENKRRHNEQRIAWQMRRVAENAMHARRRHLSLAIRLTMRLTMIRQTWSATTLCHCIYLRWHSIRAGTRDD